MGKVKCVVLRDGYEYHLTKGKEYEVLDICEGMFAGDYYVTVKGDKDRKTTGHYWRFGITKEQCKEYIKNQELEG